MGLFGGGNSSNYSSTSIDNSVEQYDYSKNTNNAGASIGNTDNSSYSDSSTTITTVTDGGAFDVAQSSLDAGFSFGSDALSYSQDVMDGGLEFGNNALDVSSKTLAGATDLVKSVNQSSLDFGQSSLDAAVDSIRDTNAHSRQLIGQTIDKSLAVASTATQSDSVNTMQSVTKIGIALAVVFGVGFIAMGMKK